MDWITILILILLIATLIAYFTGAFPYPFGWLILLALLMGRFWLVGFRKNTNK